jgi:hypothetical protein
MKDFAFLGDAGIDHCLEYPSSPGKSQIVQRLTPSAVNTAMFSRFTTPDTRLNTNRPPPPEGLNRLNSTTLGRTSVTVSMLITGISLWIMIPIPFPYIRMDAVLSMTMVTLPLSVVISSLPACSCRRKQEVFRLSQARF